MKANPRLTWECYELDAGASPGEWQQVIVDKLEADAGQYRYDTSRHNVRIWNPAERTGRCPSGGWQFRDGFEIERVYIGDRADVTHVSASISRLYFPEGDDEPTREPASRIFSPGSYPPVLRQLPNLPALHSLVSALNDGRVSPLLRPAHIRDTTSICHCLSYQFGNSSYDLRDIVKRGMSKRLLEIVRQERAVVPTDLALGMVGFARGPHAPDVIADQVARVLRDWGCRVELEVLDQTSVMPFLKSCTERRALLMVALQGKRGDPPPPNALNLIHTMGAMRVPFQLCSTSVVPTYSRHGLAAAVLAKCGGCLYRTASSMASVAQDACCVGLDLGRGYRNRGKTVAMTLTDTDGSLRAHWRAEKGEDETLSLAVLRRGLSWIREQAPDSASHFVVLRDGTLPHNEPVAEYQRVFGDRLTLVECVKSGTGLLHCETGQPEPGTIVRPEGSDYTILYPCVSAQSGVLTQPVKFRIVTDHEGLLCEDVASLLTALSHAATLSFQPSRLPAPVYWADGLAHVSDANLQFAGWDHLPSEQVKLSAS
jgi:hypothetical protein